MEMYDISSLLQMLYFITATLLLRNATFEGRNATFEGQTLIFDLRNATFFRGCEKMTTLLHPISVGRSGITQDLIGIEHQLATFLRANAVFL